MYKQYMLVIQMRSILGTSIIILVAHIPMALCASQCTSIPNCISCSSNDQCTLCTPPMVVSNNTCVMPSQNITPSAATSTSTPTQTPYSYSISGNKAQPAPMSIPVIKFSSIGYQGTSACILSWKGLCIICGHGFEMTDGGDCIIRFQQCMSYSTSSLCVVCHRNFELERGQCTDRGCETNTYYHCSACKKQYKLNKYGHCENIGCSEMKNGKCALCDDAHNLQNGVCLIKQNVNAPAANNKTTNETILNQPAIANPTSQPQIQQNNSVVAVQTAFVDEHCIKVNINRCLKCEQGYYVGQNRHCTVLPEHCLEETCMYCKTGYISINSKCIPLTNCVRIQGNICIVCQASYSVTMMGTCIKTIDYCLEYSPSGCVRCPANYALEDGRMCRLNSSYSDPNCNINDYKGQCVMCKEKYRLQPKYSNLCMSTNTQCKLASKSGQCLGCYEGYTLNAVSGECIQVKTIQNCAEQVEGECRKCASRYYLVSSYTCKEVDALCKDYDNVMGYCLSCYSGYVLRGNVCEVLMNMATQHTNSIPATSNANVPASGSGSGPSGVQNCRALEGGDPSRCQSCYDGYFVNVTNGKCAGVNALCKSYDSTNGYCLSCFEGYSLSDQSCTPQTLAPTHCKTTSQPTGECLECIDRYYKVGEQCMQVSPLCNAYDGRSGQCTTCYSGYVLHNNECVVEGSNNGGVLNCQQYTPSNTSKCAKCTQRYYLKQGACQAVSQVCGKYDQATGECITCAQGYVMAGDKVCVMPALGPDEQCAVYDDHGYCLSCAAGHQLTNFVCV